MLIGLYRDRNPLKTIRKERLLALVNEALKQNVKLVVFETKDVNFKTQEINGKIFNGTIWENKKTPFPAIMINEIPGLTKNRSDGEKKLREKIKCTSFLIGNKKDIYNKLNKHAQLKNLVIPTITMKHAEEALNFLDSKYSKIVIKPVNGKQGRNVYLIEKTNKTYLVKDHVENKEYSKEDILKFIGELLKEKTYLLQPYIECKTVDDEPYDYRIHIQRNGNGEWSLTKMYPRMGDKNSILSNISRGGHTEDINDFLQKEFSDHSSDVANMLKTTAFEVAEYIDSFYKFSIDELGIDLAIDTNGDLWLYEVNAGPQSRYHEDLRAVNMISYAKYLTKKYETIEFDNKSPIIGMMKKGALSNTMTVASHHVAAAKNANFYFFTPDDIQKDSNIIYGYEVKYGGKTFKQFPLPNVIYDLVKGKDLAKYKEAYSNIDKWNIPISYNLKNRSVPKNEIYELLNKNKLTQPYLIPYEVIKNASQTINFIKKHKIVIAKAKEGLGGKSIHRVEYQENDDIYIIKFQHETKKMTQDQLELLIQNKWSNKFIIQKYVQSLTKSGCPFDVRIHLVRSEDTSLKVAESYARIGNNKGVVSNLSSGGYMRKLKDFIPEEYTTEEAKLIKRNLNTAIRRIVKLVDEKYSLDMPEVGLDFAISGDEGIWLFEYNIFAPDSTMHEYEIADLMIPYLNSLAKNNK